MSKKRNSLATFQLPIHNPDLFTIITYDNPRCNYCHNICSLNVLNDSLQICSDCISSNELKSDELDKIKYEYSELQSDYDDIQSELEDAKSELSQLIPKLDDLESNHNYIQDQLSDTKAELRIISSEYNKMYALIKELQSSNLCCNENYTDFEDLKNYDLYTIDELID